MAPKSIAILVMIPQQNINVEFANENPCMKKKISDLIHYLEN